MSLKNKLVGKLRSEVMDVTVGATGLTPSQIYNVAEAAKNIMEGAATPTPKSVSGATDVYLKKIMKDFNNFSKSDAEVELKEYIKNYLENKYEDASKVSNIVFNKITIAGYQKSEEYATIKYQISCGYDVAEEGRVETRYKIDYSLRFVQSDDNTALAYTCPNCNATLGIMDVHECPYCGAKLVMDTLYSWNVASLEEA